jgi:hypothetical protein
MNLPKTKKEADAIGAKFYDTGKPCKHGHYGERRTSSGTCEECNRTRSRESYRQLTPEQKAERAIRLG